MSESVQCLLKHTDSKIMMYAWIPSEHARAGKLIDIRARSGPDDWSQGWKVERVYAQIKRDLFEVREHQRIDLPSIE